MSSGVRVAIVLTLFWTSVLALPDFRGGIFMARPTGRTEYQVSCIISMSVHIPRLCGEPGGGQAF